MISIHMVVAVVVVVIVVVMLVGVFLGGVLVVVGGILRKGGVVGVLLSLHSPNQDLPFRRPRLRALEKEK